MNLSMSKSSTLTSFHSMIELFHEKTCQDGGSIKRLNLPFWDLAPLNLAIVSTSVEKARTTKKKKKNLSNKC